MSDATPVNLWESFEAVSAREPGAPALIFPDETVSFGELREQAERCAAWLARQDVQRGDVAAIQLPKRRKTYPLWLACLRQGVTYVFVDARNPVERTERMLERVRPALFVTTTDHRNAYGRTVVLPDAEDDRSWMESLPPQDQAPPAARQHGLDPAYIMFTSGSTGEPKGAVIPHQGVLSLRRWARTHLCLSENTRFSNINPLHFDNSVFDLYCGLMNGKALIPIETGALSNPMAWVRQLREARASVVFGVPTLFLTLDRLSLLTPESLPDVRLFLFGGEGFPIAALKAFHRRFGDQARLINVYGPTETSCICSSIEIDDAQLAAAGTGFASLGRMHADFDHLILDDTGAQAAIGELWIGGACVGLGYYANPSETAARFRQDPRQEGYRSIWYRTGDLVREDEAGLLWFQGRADNQVKIRGHRIELEEIDLAVEQIPGMRRAVCVAATGDDGPELRLAFAADREISLEDVHACCTSKLPHYMQPARILRLDTIPENANGKADRKAVSALMAELE